MKHEKWELMHKYSKYKYYLHLLRGHNPEANCSLWQPVLVYRQLQTLLGLYWDVTGNTRSHLNPGSSKLLAGNNMTVREDIPQHITERRGRVVGIPASYPRDPRVQISVQRPAIPTEFLWFFSVPPGKFWESTLNKAKTASSHILSISSLTFHPSIRCYIVRSVNQWKSVDKQTYCISLRKTERTPNDLKNNKATMAFSQILKTVLIMYESRA
jgi:hypothetical protein